MADGLLLTRRERMRLYRQKLACGYGPSLLLGIVVLVLGGGGVGWMILIIGAALGFFVASSAKTVRGALIGGVACAVILFVFQLVVGHIVSHPIQSE